MLNEEGLFEVARKLVSDRNSDASRMSAAYSSIIEHCKKHYVSILPNNINRWMETSSSPSAMNERDDSKSSDIDKLHIQQLIRQLSDVLQLLIQVCVLSEDSDSRLKSYNLLEKVRQLMVRDVSQTEEILLNQTGRELPRSKVNLTDFVIQEEQKKEPIVVDMPPQMSMYQDPLIYLCFHRSVHKRLFQSSSTNDSQSTKIELLKEYAPFINPIYIPVMEESSSKPNKAKFSVLDDRLLLIGLIKHTSKNIDCIQNIYVPSHTQDQLKNRIKNLCAKNNANEIKTYKQNEYMPLTDNQLRRFAEGLVRFGPRFIVISKYLSLRTARFLEEEYNQSDRLFKKRERENICKTSIKEKLQQYQAQFMGNMEVERQDNDMSAVSIIRSESYFLQQPILSRALREDSACEPIQPEEQKREHYKIIGNMTFEYDEL